MWQDGGDGVQRGGMEYNMTRIFLWRTTLCLWRTFAIDYPIEGLADDLRGAVCPYYDTILRRSVST